MINHGTVRATEAPETLHVDECSVWVASDIQTVTVKDENGERTEYEFTLLQYDKDEYIRHMAEVNASLDMQMTETQLALCDVYELIEQ